LYGAEVNIPAVSVGLSGEPFDVRTLQLRLPEARPGPSAGGWQINTALRNLGPAIERFRKAPDKGVNELFDLDTGRTAGTKKDYKNEPKDGRTTEAWDLATRSDSAA
jgi:hypothetical protein